MVGLGLSPGHERKPQLRKDLAGASFYETLMCFRSGALIAFSGSGMSPLLSPDVACQPSGLFSRLVDGRRVISAGSATAIDPRA